MTTTKLYNAEYRLATCYLDKLRFAEHTYWKGGESVRTGLAALEQEFMHIQRWRVWAFDHSKVDTCAAQLCILFALDAEELLQIRLSPAEYLTWLQQALECARQLNDLSAQCRLLVLMANRYFVMSAPAQAQACAQEGAILAENLGRARLRARCLEVLGEIAWVQPDYQKARVYFEQSLAFLRMDNDLSQIARGLLQMVSLSYSEGNFAETRRYAEECLGLFRILGDQRGRARSLLFLGYVEYENGQAECARLFLTEAVRIYQQLGETSGEIYLLIALSDCEIALDNMDDARNYLNRACDLARREGYVTELTNLQLSLSRLACLSGDFKTAYDYVEQCRNTWEAAADTRGVAHALRQIGDIAAAEGDYLRAQTAYEHALRLFKSYNGVHGIINCLIAIGAVWLNQDKLDNALLTIREAAGFVRRLNQKTSQDSLLMLIAEYWWVAGSGRNTLSVLDFMEKGFSPTAEIRKRMKQLRTTISSDAAQFEATPAHTIGNFAEALLLVEVC